MRRGKCTEWEIIPDFWSMSPKRTYFSFVGEPLGYFDQSADSDEDRDDCACAEEHTLTKIGKNHCSILYTVVLMSE